MVTSLKTFCLISDHSIQNRHTVLLLAQVQPHKTIQVFRTDINSAWVALNIKYVFKIYQFTFMRSSDQLGGSTIKTIFSFSYV